MAVWAWNAMIAWVCGDTVVWKPSEKTAALGDGLPEPGCPRDPGEMALGSRGRQQPADRQRRGSGTSARGLARSAFDFKPRFGADGPRGGANGCQPLAARCWNWGGNTGRIVALRPIWISRCGRSSSPRSALGGQRCTTLRRLIGSRIDCRTLARSPGEDYDHSPSVTRRRRRAGGPLIDENAWARCTKH